MCQDLPGYARIGRPERRFSTNETREVFRKCETGGWASEILHQLIGGLSHYSYGFNMFQPSKVMQDFATFHSM